MTSHLNPSAAAPLPASSSWLPCSTAWSCTSTCHVKRMLAERGGGPRASLWQEPPSLSPHSRHRRQVSLQVSVPLRLGEYCCALLVGKAMRTQVPSALPCMQVKIKCFADTLRHPEPARHSQQEALLYHRRMGRQEKLGQPRRAQSPRRRCSPV
jgi:hypothetical protein